MTARFALLLALLLPSALAIAPPASAAKAATPPALALVEGQDYVLIDGGKAFAPAAGKIEVAEIFMYTCHHCADFDPMVQAWKAKLPKDVRVNYVPLVYDDADAFAQAFFAAQALGMVDRTHSATFNAVHEAHALPSNPTLDELAAFYATLGVDQAKFKAAAASPAVAARLAQARAFALGSGMEGTPSVVVNGKYLVRGRNYEELLRITGQLVAREREALRRR